MPRRRQIAEVTGTALVASTPRRAPPIPSRSRFIVGEYARITHTSVTFRVAAVSADGETITTRKGKSYLARFCEHWRLEDEFDGN